MYKIKSEKIRNLPKEIWLQIGDDEPLEDWEKLPAGHEISWCEHKIFDNDVRYVLDKRRLKVGRTKK